MFGCLDHDNGLLYKFININVQIYNTINLH